MEGILTFWNTVLAVVLANAIYDLVWMIFLGNKDDYDDPDPA